jgi:FkbM family methyltransferase
MLAVWRSIAMAETYPSIQAALKSAALSVLLPLYKAGTRLRAKHDALRAKVASTREQESGARGEHFHLFHTAKRGVPLKMLLQCPGEIEERLIRNGEWEPSVREVIDAFLQDDGTFIDVGANIGPHTLFIAASRKKSKVLAFEPHPEIFRQLQLNISLNNLPNVEARQLAVGDTQSTVILFAQELSAYNRGLSSVVSNYDLDGTERAIHVPQITLDSFVESNSFPKISVIKIDTQGSELSVLKGAHDVISHDKPVIIFEFVSDYLNNPPAEFDEIKNLLTDYEILALRWDKPGILMPFDSAVVSQKGFWSDLVCIPRVS